MRYALFLGCKIPYYLPQYETATRLVLGELGLSLQDLEFGCCGYPMRQLYPEAGLLAAAKALAQAEAQGLDILTPCMCCFGNLKRAKLELAQDDQLRKKANQSLREENLNFTGNAQVKHLLSVLYHELDLDDLKEKIQHPLKGLKVAVLNGCHALRPSKVTQFDHPTEPVIFERLVELTGAVSVPWQGHLSCCGAHIREVNDQLSLDMIHRRLKESREAGADLLCLSCTYCQMQADWAGQMLDPAQRKELVSGTILYPQLLGLSLGIPGQALGVLAQAAQDKIPPGPIAAQATAK